jgi:Domain of unknown function (DUF4145)
VGIEAADPDPKPIRGHCPRCGPDRNAEVVGEHVSPSQDEEFWGETKYRILVCRGCDSVYFQVEALWLEPDYLIHDPETVLPTRRMRHFPSPITRDLPNWAQTFESEKLLAELGIGDTGQLWLLFDDIYDCLNANLTIPAAIAIRTTFDKATEFLAIDTNLSFDKKLNALFDLGKISEDEREILQILVDAGSAAAHRGWRPSATNLDTLIDLIENFLYRTFVLTEAARELKGSVPPRPKRSTKL